MITAPLDRREDRVAAALVVCGFAAGIAHALLRSPVQVSDALETIVRAANAPSAGAAFVRSLSFSPTMLRPLDYTMTRWLLDAGASFGGRYQLIFRSFHAALAVALIALFVAALRPRVRADLIALPLVLTVFTGLHTFAGMMREAYPINHFLVVAVCAMTVLVVSRSRGGLLRDAVALLAFILAALTLESGVLVWIVAVTAWCVGWRGLSRPALVGMTMLAAAYVCFRVGYLHKLPTGIGDHATGYGTVMLSSGEQIQRFAAHPLGFYLYNVISAISSVLFSEPRVGVWALPAIRRTTLPPSILLEILSSLGATIVLMWAAIRTSRGRLRDDVEFRRMVTLACVVTIVSGAMSYAYDKDEIISLAGVCYALAFGAALRELLVAISGTPRGVRKMMAVCCLAALALAWTWRSTGLEYKMRRSAADARAEWAAVLTPRGDDRWSRDATQTRLVRTLKHQALSLRATSYQWLPPWTGRYWGD